MKKIDWVILKRSLSGDLTEEEKKELEAWLQVSDERVQYYDKMMRFFKEEHKKDVDVDQNWDKFISRHQSSRRHILPVFTRYAAVLLLVAGVALYFNSVKREKTERQNYASVETPADRNGVKLYTGKGEEVIIENGEEQKIIVADSLNIRNENGRLDYAEISRKKVLIQEKHTVDVPRGAEFTMKLSDGTSVHLNSESTLRYPVQFNGQSRIVKLTGEAYFEVAKNGKPFIVDLGDCMIKVLGTHFNVRAYNDEHEIQTTLVEGSVEVKGINSNVLLSPGEQAVITENKTLTKRKVDVNRYIAWKNGRFVFVDERLEDVLNTISRWYNVSIFFERQLLKDIRINGTLDRDHDVSVLLRQIEKSGVAHFKLSEDVIVIN